MRNVPNIYAETALQMFVVVDGKKLKMVHLATAAAAATAARKLCLGCGSFRFYCLLQFSAIILVTQLSHTRTHTDTAQREHKSEASEKERGGLHNFLCKVQ